MVSLFVAISALGAGGPDGDRAAVDFFEKKIRPVLVERCYACHSAGAKEPNGGLLLDTRAGLRQGGKSGPAVVPGEPAASLLLRVIEQADGPHADKLPEPVIADFRRWIEGGAPDPRDAALVAKSSADASWEEALAARRGWWSLQPLREPAVPQVEDREWSARPVDRFVLAKLEAAKLTPAPPADRRTLIRRLSLVLTGLPPSPEEVEAFVADGRSDAVERLVDELLASPHFGERWTRHWLDVVRFAETHGTEWNYEVHHAWRYRDYLIRAFNQDVPYDQLVREHLAGDLLPEPRWNRDEAFNESVLGTMFYRFGEVGHDDCIEFRAVELNAVDNQIDTLAKAFQASTVACARCHDHKLDAVSAKDYYALMGIIQSSRQVTHTIDAPGVNEPATARLRELKAQIRSELAVLWTAEAEAAARYLRAAQAARDKEPGAETLGQGLDPERLKRWAHALEVEKPVLEHPLYPWLALQGDAKQGPAALEAGWRRLAARYETEMRQRAEFNAASFTAFGDFRSGDLAGWRAEGQGFRDGAVASGDLAVACEGDAAAAAVFCAGLFTHSLSEKLNGALRSPNLPKEKKYISFEVLGGRSSVIRLIPNNCQLNYRNYKVLKSKALGWIKFPALHDEPSIRAYAELATKLDNPKFPDQLGAIGGDDNMRVPWEQAAADPRSFFGITRVVLHDCEETPRDELTHLEGLLEGSAPRTEAELGQRYAAVIGRAARAWAAGACTDDDVRWLDWLVREGLIANSMRATPRLEDLVRRYREVESGLQVPRVVPGLADFDAGFDHVLYAGGDYKTPGEAVPRRYLEVMGSDAPWTLRGSGRRELAQLIASPSNPLTARVLVNRVWHHFFGTGIVRTTDDFGHMGELPSHPELLDFLAARFVSGGWSIKGLIRSLVLTRTFQMASRPVEAAREAEPENRLLHHYPARRLEAEAIRDAILAVSGRLDRTLLGPSVHAFREAVNPHRRLFPGPLDGAGRRSIYIKSSLMETPRFLAAFNPPGGKVTRGRRDVTNVPAQALALLNDPFVIAEAKLWADRLVADGAASSQKRIERMFLAALGRAPDAGEARRFEATAETLAQLHGVPATEVLSSPAVWQDVAHTLFNLTEFIYIQ